MTWRSALTRLAAIPVAGVATSYDLDSLPNSLAAADLPALAPVFGEHAGPLGQSETDFTTLTFDGSVWRARLEIEHVLYWAPAWSDAGLRAALPALIDVVDAYLPALSADGTLGGTLSEALTIVRVQPGSVEYAGVHYFGVRFRHRWVRRVQPGDTG